MVITRFAFVIAIDVKTLFRYIENYHAQETREVGDEKGEKTTKKTIIAGSRGAGWGVPGFFSRAVHH